MKTFLRFLLASALTLIAISGSAAAAGAAVCSTPIQNQVACENSKTGTLPAQWQITGAGDPLLQGYATQISTNKGGTVSFKIKSQLTGAYHIDILRIVTTPAAAHARSPATSRRRAPPRSPIA